MFSSNQVFEISGPMEQLEKSLQFALSFSNHNCKNIVEGFIMRNIPNLFSDEWKGIRNPFNGIVYFEKFYNFYAK